LHYSSLDIDHALQIWADEEKLVSWKLKTKRKPSIRLD
jgi:hypothetical protein